MTAPFRTPGARPRCRPRWTLPIVVLAALLCARAGHAQVEDDLREGDSYFEEGKYKKAAQRYDSAIERSPGRVPAEAYGKRAAIYIIQKDYRGGLLFIAERAEPQHPDSPDVLEQKALILWALGRKPEAIETAEAVVARRSDAYSNQGILGEYHAGRQPARAVTAYEAYFRHRPDSLARGDVLPRIRLGFAYLAVRRYREAEEQFQILLKRHRKEPHAEVNAHNGLCAAYTALGEYDRAITLCERIVREPRAIDRSGSVWYNLGRAYLEKRRPERAREAGAQFVRARRDSPKGYTLIGDSYFQQRDWSKALQLYIEAEKRAKGGESAVELSVKLGATYSRLGRPDDAIRKLEGAFAVNPDNVTLASELGNAYLAARRDGKALAAAERIIGAASFATLDDADRVALLLIAGRSLYNQGELARARERYTAAYRARKSDVTVRIGLVQTVNLQAYEAMSRGQLDRAETLLSEAYGLDRSSSITNRNLAVLALGQGRCDGAKKYLAALEKSPADELMYHRLLARAYVCQRRPDRDAAARHYALAEKKALDPQLQANLLRAEIYTEWAPLLFESNLDSAIEKLDIAVQLAARSPEVGNAARRNLALASYRRGWQNMRAGKLAAAIADFETASGQPDQLRGTEELVFTFSLALAYLEDGSSTRAARLFDQLAGKARRARFLAEPYDRLGVRFFDAYAKYRGGNRRQRKQAVREFTRMENRAQGPFARRLRELIAATWLLVASDAYRVGRMRGVREGLQNASRYASSSKMKRIVTNNEVVLAMSSRSPPRTAEATLQDIADSVPEALANLGILLDRQGNAQQAHDYWVRARQRGVRSRNLQQWINAKKRMFGY